MTDWLVWLEPGLTVDAQTGLLLHAADATKAAQSVFSVTLGGITLALMDHGHQLPGLAGAARAGRAGRRRHAPRRQGRGPCRSCRGWGCSVGGACSS